MSASIRTAAPLPQHIAATAVAALPQAEGVHFLAPLDARAVTLRVQREEAIVEQDARAEFCYLVVSGCIRTVRLLEDGRRQVAEFLLPGDVFGFDSLDRHDFAAEAVTEATLRRYARRAIDALAAENLGFARRVNSTITAQLRAGRERIVALGRCTAGERISGFLLDMAERMRAAERTSFELPMNRTDIADYLGLTVETVSRRMTELGRNGAIAVKRAQVTIRDRRVLH